MTATGGYVRALQDALAAEHAAVYAYGVLAGRLSTGTVPQARAAAAYRRHLVGRDRLVDHVTAAGATPVAAEVAYALPVEVGPATASTVARQVEDRCTVPYAAVVAAAPPRRRGFALTAWTACATALVDWGGEPTALPGVGQP